MTRERGFSLLELVVSIGLISILVGVFLDRALYYREQAEKAAMEQVAMDIRSSVNLRAAELVLDNRFAQLKVLASGNPMDLLVRKPQNYLGVLPATAPEGVKGGNWYFDNKAKEIVYYVDLGRYFTPDARGEKRVAWHVVLVPGARGEKLPQWARFELVAPYRWF